MGSPPAPHLANGWLSQFEDRIRGEAQLYDRYMYDILREIKKSETSKKLAEVNSLHPNLQFTTEGEMTELPEYHLGKLRFLDMKFIHDQDKGLVSSTWYH